MVPSQSLSLKVLIALALAWSPLIAVYNNFWHFTNSLRSESIYRVWPYLHNDSASIRFLLSSSFITFCDLTDPLMSIGPLHTKASDSFLIWDKIHFLTFLLSLKLDILGCRSWTIVFEHFSDICDVKDTCLFSLVIFYFIFSFVSMHWHWHGFTTATLKKKKT